MKYKCSYPIRVDDRYMRIIWVMPWTSKLIPRSPWHHWLVEKAQIYSSKPVHLGDEDYGDTCLLSCIGARIFPVQSDSYSHPKSSSWGECKDVLDDEVCEDLRHSDSSVEVPKRSNSHKKRRQNEKDQYYRKKKKRGKDKPHKKKKKPNTLHINKTLHYNMYGGRKLRNHRAI